MDDLIQALQQNPELAIFLALAIGFGIGRVKIDGFSLGTVVGTLFAGVLIGQLDIKVSPLVRTVFWRGLYDLKGLGGDIVYNGNGGGEILLII